ncbi:ESX secretion-associated protein EspG [Nocardia stercoris]|uniref:ESX secretion-associated protein EspG n=1 Tax=Nocardia stercoris TaxID=2483361 RepID=A0A3M2LC04_9NOCA|nr:ESX secretion-associated protein EspG [Nocardia stercoris]RMI35079.1 ESX secretion-associated protein EspG [Nocardia stercoris]
MRWTLTPDRFALAWERIDGDRIPYPLAVRRSARDSAERAAQLPALLDWCATELDADLTAALRVLTRPDIRVEVYGTAGPHPVRVLGVAAGAVTVVAAQQPGPRADRGADVILVTGTMKTLAARIVSFLPEMPPGSGPRLSAPVDQVKATDRPAAPHRMPTAPGTPAGPFATPGPAAAPKAPHRQPPAISPAPTSPFAIPGPAPAPGPLGAAVPEEPSPAAAVRRLLSRPRDGLGQMVISARRDTGALRPLAVLCWIDVRGDGRYAVHTRTEVEITPVTAEAFADLLRTPLAAAERITADTVRLRPTAGW